MFTVPSSAQTRLTTAQKTQIPPFYEQFISFIGTNTLQISSFQRSLNV